MANSANQLTMIMKDMFKFGKTTTLAYSKVVNTAISKGFSEAQINQAFNELAMGDMYIINKEQDFIEKIN